MFVFLLCIIMKILSFDVGIKNLAFCIFNTEHNTINEWQILDITSHKNENSCATMVRILDTVPDMLAVDLVLIEKQPSKNNKMRIIEGLLNAYFVIKGITNNDSTIREVKVYSAKHKLGNDTYRGKVNYSQRKKLGVFRTHHFIKEYSQSEHISNLFETSKKKDDLADCLLQALSYCNIEIECNTEQFCKQEKIISREPSKKQKRTRYSKCNIKWLLQNINKSLSSDSDTTIVSEINSSDRLKKDILYWFKSVDNCLQIILI